jgi:short-subunit dehydrogenase
MAFSNLKYLKFGILSTLAAGIILKHSIRKSRKFPLSGKIALVTGGSRGLGLLIARELLQAGCKVIICARSIKDLKEAERFLKQYGTEVFWVSCDLSLEKDCKKLVEEVQTRFGTLHILVNNAGIIVSAPYYHMSDADYAEQMQIHFWAPYRLIQAFLPEFRKNSEGRIVNISSIGGKIPVPHLLPYTASKFALRGYSEGLRTELAKKNIFVTTVCPGLMRTGSQINAFFKGNYEAEYAWFKTLSAVPGISISANRAAQKIVEALQYGEGEVVLGPSAKLASLLYGIYPNLVGAALEVSDQVLPEGDGKDRLKGRDISLPKGISLVTRGLDAAAEKNNEV